MTIKEIAAMCGVSRGTVDRVLNGRGRKSCKAVGRWLRDEGQIPDQVLCSSAVRTRRCTMPWVKSALNGSSSGTSPSSYSTLVMKRE